jgi:restriction endonuclease Mrr
MLLAPNRRRTRRRTSSVKRGVSSKDCCAHTKLDGWKNAHLSAILMLFHSGRTVGKAGDGKIDGVIDHGIGVTRATSYEVKRLDSDYFEES